ncbi:MAG: SusC/RagA family TonB-linked outer membrane protein [Gemmatimonadaceae bacterium]
MYGRVRSVLSRATAAALFAFALCAASAAPALAQSTGVIRGRVIESGSQRGVAEAQVTITGTTLGAVTNANGDFTITGVPAGAHELSVRRIGYGRRTQSVTVVANATTAANFDVVLAASQLDAVIVTGTGGGAEKRTLGNSITTLDVADITSRNSILSVTEVLQSRTPGVSILPGSGAPGTAGEIRIRGASSLSGYRPVVYVDGIRYNIDELGSFSATGGGTLLLAASTQVTSALNNLNPNDIESIEVVKGPAAATLYGAEAANGVIQIITKKGRRGQQALQWSLRAERGQTDWRLLPEDNLTTCDAIKQGLLQTDGTPLWPGCQGLPVNTIISDNPLRRDDRAIRAGQLSRFSSSLRGGGDRYSFYLATDRDVEQGVFFNSDNNRTSIRSNFGFNPSEKLDFALNVNWSSGRLRLPIQDESANGLLLSATRGRPGLARPAGSEGWSIQSPTSANRYKNFTETDRSTLGATVTYRPFRWLDNRVTVGIDNTASQAQLLFLPGEIEITQDPDAASGANLRNNLTRSLLSFDYAGTMEWNVRPTLLSTTKFGSQIVSDKSESLRATGIGIGAPDVTLVNLLQRSTGGEGFSENNSVGYYLQEQLGWNDRLFVTGALRADDHSSFGTNFDWIVYPKFSMSYVMSEEPRFRGFLDRTRINSLKLRGAWGQAGRAPSAYSAPQTYTVDRVTLGTTTASALRTNTFGNPDLKPERGEEIELGFDLGFLNDRVGVDFTFYNKRTSDMLQSISVPPSSGFISSRLTNLGEVTNKGIELSLFGTPINRPRFSWDTRLNISRNTNELVSFGIEGKEFDTPAGQPFAVVQQHRAGYPLGGFWVIPPQRGPDGAALLTPTGGAIFNTGDTARRYIGPSTPTREIGFSNTITFLRSFRLSALLDHKGGFYVFNQQERSRCQPANDNCSRTNNPSARFPLTPADTILFKELAVYRSTTNAAPEWIQKGDFIKLRELSLTVDLPRRLLTRSGAKSGALILSGRNLALWSDYEGNDPEVNTYGGRNFVRVDAYAAPMMRRMTAAINLQF